MTHTHTQTHLHHFSTYTAYTASVASVASVAVTSSACSSQVEPGNEPALNFYRRLGFEAFTKYHTTIELQKL